MRAIAALAFALVVVASVAATPATAGAVPGEPSDAPATQGADACDPVSDDDRPDPETDQLGWEDGCWYDQSLQVTHDDGLNETELDAVVARTMARVEQLRGLEFEESVPVEVLTRSEFREETGQAFANPTENERLHQNVKYEALFMVGEGTDAIAEIRENRGTTVLGYYDPTEDRIVLVSDDEETPQVDEFTLAHELVHALQDQQFGLGDFQRRTTEENNALNGLVEGDANYVQHLYERRCDGEWQCSSPGDGGGGGVPEGFHWGIYFLNFQPYSDGPTFVQEIRDAGGWNAVNDLYEDPPNSTEQVIDPPKYGDDEPANVTVEDLSSDRWRVPRVPGVEYAEYGEAGIFTMFLYPTYETQGTTQFVTVDEFVRRGPDGEPRDLDPLNYSHRFSDGWDGDRLYPYVTDDSAATNETGYVWKTVWDSPAEAREFVDGYERLLEFRGAQPVDGRVNTYRIPDERPYGDAFYVEQRGDTVVVVNAPSVEELGEVRAGAAPTTAPPSTPTPANTSTGGHQAPG